MSLVTDSDARVMNEVTRLLGPQQELKPYAFKVRMAIVYPRLPCSHFPIIISFFVFMPSSLSFLIFFIPDVCIYIYIYERERERIADINTDLYDFHLLFFLSLYLNIAISTTPFFFLKKMDTISGLRYRAEEAMRAVSRHAVRTARRKEIEEEIINSEKLKVYS